MRESFSKEKESPMVSPSFTKKSKQSKFEPKLTSFHKTVASVLSIASATQPQQEPLSLSANFAWDIKKSLFRPHILPERPTLLPIDSEKPRKFFSISTITKRLPFCSAETSMLILIPVYTVSSLKARYPLSIKMKQSTRKEKQLISILILKDLSIILFIFAVLTGS